MLDIWGPDVTIILLVHVLCMAWWGLEVYVDTRLRQAPCSFARGTFAEDSMASAEALWCGATGGWLQLSRRTGPCPQSPCWSWSVTVQHSNHLKSWLWLTTVIITRQFLCSCAACESCDKLPPQIRIGSNPKWLTGQCFVVHVSAGAKWNLSCKSDSAASL